MNRKRNSQKKTNKRTNNNRQILHRKLKIRQYENRKSWDELVSSGRACSSSTSNTHHATVKRQDKVYDMDFGLDTIKTKINRSLNQRGYQNL